MTKILFFFPHNPYPAKSGAHRRCLQMLAGLKALGCDITLLSSTTTSETPWNPDSIAHLTAHWVSHVALYTANPRDRHLEPWIHRYYRLTRQRHPLSSPFNTPFGMRQWFVHQFRQTQPDLIFMNYAYWDKLTASPHLAGTPKIIDSHDLVTLNVALQTAIKAVLPPVITPTTVIDPRVLQEDFFQPLNLEATAEEFAIFDHYDRTIVISEKEVELVQHKTRKTHVSYIPVLQSAIACANQYTTAAVFATGPNWFNLQGYLYFVHRILPTVLAQDPSFQLQVTGACCQQVYPTPGIELLGYVPDLTAIYQTAKFAICPVFGGTGQQIKIVEAMAHGLPVVATRFAGERSPIIHGENGFIANDAQEFAAYVLHLWRDRDRCQHLGHQARTTIAQHFSQQRLVTELAAIVHPQPSSV